ncbi:YozQ family protein [Bacillus sp. FSL M8-0052]|uniref:DUF4025 domain-containing protein n=1 Tax=Bacillus glycinifermentans TaxID=1664069 RepID=A0AAJ3YYW9_9BACI|nr:YozQ family protein [Bacillus glycinifermentans]NUJ15164.1 DUF4025 domain-containing protein [Bacillus glycinifermentans]QAT65662.1 DUF4025 domain-containing protein [Bacillus glycinifermentans]
MITIERVNLVKQNRDQEIRELLQKEAGRSDKAGAEGMAVTEEQVSDTHMESTIEGGDR